MSEVTFCKQFLTALDARPQKLASDHIADPRQYPEGAIFILPKLPPPHPSRPSAPPPPSTSSSSTTTTTLGTTTSTSHIPQKITLKPLKPTFPTHTFPPTSRSSPSKTSIYDLKSFYATTTSIPLSKIKILYNKKPVADSKTVAEVVGSTEAGEEVEFGVMVIGGAVAAGTPAQSPPAAAPGMEVGGAEGEAVVPAAQGPSGKEAVDGDDFWEDLRGFVVQRIRDEKEGERLVGVFKRAWEKDR